MEQIDFDKLVGEVKTDVRNRPEFYLAGGRILDRKAAPSSPPTGSAADFFRYGDFGEAVRHFHLSYIHRKNPAVLADVDAKTILLLFWFATDPEAHTFRPLLARLQAWPWEDSPGAHGRCYMELDGDSAVRA